MDSNFPPILQKVNSPTSEESIQLLQSIDSSLEIVAGLSKREIGLPKKTDGFNPRKKENPLEDIQKSLVDFQKSIANSLDVSSLSKEDARSYLETRKKQAEKERDAIVDAIDEMKTSLFKKKSMTEEDVDTLNELNKIYESLNSNKTNENDIDDEDSRVTTKLDEIKEGIEKSFKEGFTTITQGVATGLLGPMNMIISPIEDLFGFKLGGIFSELFSKDDRDKKKDLNKKFIKPKRSDMLKYHPEAVYLADMIAGPNAEGTEADSIIDKLFGGKATGMAGKVLPFLAKAIPIAAIIGSLVMAVFDGFKASKMADEWGVSSIEAFIGGFLAGTGSGWKNAFKNAGKWGLMGAGVGFLAGGPVGAIVGGLLGAAVGGILGYFGGEKVAQGVKKIGEWFNETFDLKKIIELSPIGAVLRFVDKMKETWGNPDKTIGEKLKDTTKGIFVMFKDILFAPFNFMSELFKGNIIKKHIPLKDIGKKLGSWVNDGIAGLLKKTNLEGTPVGNFATQMGNWAMGVFTNYLGGIEATFTDFASLLKGDMKFKDFAFNLVKRVFGGIGNFFDDFLSKNPIGKFITSYIITPITEFFAKIGDTFEYFASFDNILDVGKAFISGSLFSGLADYQKRSADVRIEERRSKVIEAHKEELGKDYTNYKAMQRANIPGAKDQKNKLIDKLLERGLINKVEVNDAIVHPSGRIIVPHKDDTIIATKNPVNKRNKSFAGNDNDIQDLLSEKLDSKDSFDDNRIVKALEKVVAAIEEKPFNNVMTNVSNNKEPNFNDLRFAF